MKKDQLKAGVILSYLSEGITILSGLIYTPIMLRLLGQSEYGLYQLATSTISYLSLFSLGFGSAYIRYYSKHKVNNDEKSIARLNGMFMTIFMFLGLLCVAVGTVLVGNAERMFSNSLSVQEIKTTKILMGFMIFNMAISFPSGVFGSYITANEQYIFQKTVNILKSTINPFLTLPLLLMGYKSVALVSVQTALSITAFCANMIFCTKKLHMSFNFKGFDFRILKELFCFSFFIFLNQIVDQINWSVDNFILGIYKGSVAVAVYGVAAHINKMYIMFSSSISNVFAPRINRIVFQSNDNHELTELFTKIGRIQFIILMLVAYGFVIFGKYFISLWAGPGYNESYIITMILILPATVPLIQNLGVEIQQAKNMHQFRSIVYIIMAMLNLSLSIVLVRHYGGTGAAIGTAASLLLGNGLIMNIYYHKKIELDIKYFWKNILSFVPALILPTVIGIVIIKYVTFVNIPVFIGTILIFILVYSASMWFLGLNVFEKELIRKYLSFFRRKV